VDGLIFLQTERLLLKRLTPDDAPALFRYRSLPEICRYQSFQPAEIADAVTFITGTSDKIDVTDTWYQLGIFPEGGVDLIGDIGIHFLPDAEVELGYTLAPDFQRKGYATEALLPVIDHLFKKLAKRRITCSINSRNEPSIPLAGRLGLRPIYRARPDDGDLMYEITAGDWMTEYRKPTD